MSDSFTISACDAQKYQETRNALEAFAKTFANTSQRLKKLEQITDDGQITSVEITRDFLDLNQNGLTVDDFYEKQPPLGGLTKAYEQKLSRSAKKLTAIFAAEGVELAKKILNYGSYYNTVTSDNDIVTTDYVSAPYIFRDDPVFISHSIATATQHDSGQFIRAAYLQATRVVRQQQEWSASFTGIAPRLIDSIPASHKHNVFLKSDSEQAKEILQIDPSVVKQLSTDNVNEFGWDYLSELYQASPNLMPHLNPLIRKSLVEYLHSGSVSNINSNKGPVL